MKKWLIAIALLVSGLAASPVTASADGGTQPPTVFSPTAPTTTN